MANPKQQNGYVTWPKLAVVLVALAGAGWTGFDAHENRLDDQSTHDAVTDERLKHVQKTQDAFDKKLSEIKKVVDETRDAVISIKAHLQVKE